MKPGWYKSFDTKWHFFDNIPIGFEIWFSICGGLDPFVPLIPYGTGNPRRNRCKRCLQIIRRKNDTR